MKNSTQYNPLEVEDKWYDFWLKNEFFHANPNPQKESYTIVIPPPNVTGVLHMGHMLNNTIQDILIRKERMSGKEVCWVPGVDHASIATEAKVVDMLRKQGIKKSDLSRDKFLKYAWEWKEKHGGIILEQLKKLGASCDWNRTTFTMDTHYEKAVIRQFVDLYNKGYIYRDYRMVNWDCEAQTTVSNEEVVYEDRPETSTLYKIRYQIKDSHEFLIIATQRPETVMGDTGVAVNPHDERYKSFIGRKVIIPFVNREVSIVGDDYVEMDFGTGCLKVTPAHDINDYEIGKKHGLEVIDIIDPDGKINDKCGIEKYVGKDRFVVRKEVVKDLKEEGILMGEESFQTKIGRSERTQSVIEPKLSLQWFIRMEDISKKALDVVVDEEIKLYPKKFKKTYIHWMNHIKDWCISRQLWWGQRIPVYYYGKGSNDFVVAETAEEALKLAQIKTNTPKLTLGEIKQEEDVLDTWASSNLWPIAVFDGFNDSSFDKETGKIDKTKNKLLNYFYPTNTLVTAPEILFFWVARMIVAGYEYLNEKPFENVYLTGIVRDKKRRKMSKSLGNSPDPLELIKKYGSDGVRTGMLFTSPAGNDLLFDEKLCEQGRNFSNKLWNAFRLIRGWEVKEMPIPTENKVAVRWLKNKFYKELENLENHFSKFRISDALMTVYKFVWDDFCSSFLEWIKPTYGHPIDKKTYDETIAIFEDTLKILHPFMPFITEELWQNITTRRVSQALIISDWPEKNIYEQTLLQDITLIFLVVNSLRNLRSTQGISPKNKLNLVTDNPTFLEYESTLKKMANLKNITISKKQPIHSVGFTLEKFNYVIPVEKQHVDKKSEIKKIKQEIAYANGFMQSVNKKLTNKQFVKNAPEEVVVLEKKKLKDIQEKINTLKKNLQRLEA